MDLIAILKIIGIDILLSGDNAVVIALAARGLPRQQQRLAVGFGTFGAVAMRIALALVAAALLQVAGLKLLGAALLLWIAVKLLLPQDDDRTHIDGSSRLRMAVWTIMSADLAMSLDNVVAVAAVANGSAPLLIFGLAVSIPLVVLASTFLMRLMERFPIVITGGAALLGFVALEMAVSDAIAAPVVASVPWLSTALPLAGAVTVVMVAQLVSALRRGNAA